MLYTVLHYNRFLRKKMSQIYMTAVPYLW